MKSPLHNTSLPVILLVALLIFQKAVHAQPLVDWETCYKYNTVPGWGYPKNIALDQEDNILACGYIGENDTTQPQMSIVKYDPDGNELWNFNLTFNTEYPAMAFGVTADNENNVIATGETGDTMVTLKLNPAGTLLWIQKFAVNMYWNHGLDVQVLNDNSIIAVGSVSNDSVALLKYSADGDLLWTRFREKQFYFGFIYSRFDEAGNTYLCYQVPGTDGYVDAEVCKYNADGDLLWVYDYSSLFLTAFATDFDISNDGCAYILLRNYGDALILELAKIDSVGSLAWVKPLNNFPENDYFTYAFAIDVSDNKRIAVGGEQYSEFAESDYYNLAQFDDNGALLWQHSSFPWDATLWGMELATDQYNYVYWLAGWQNSDVPSGFQLGTAKFSTDGVFKWELEYNEDGIPVAMTVKNENIYELVVGEDDYASCMSVVNINQDVIMQTEESINSIITCYPNPASSQITFSANDNTQIISSSTFDATGQQVELYPAINKPCNITHLAQGLYHTISNTTSGLVTNTWVKF